MKRFRDKVAASLTVIMVLTMVLGFTTSAQAAESRSPKAYLDAYNIVRAYAYKVNTLKAYTGNEEVFGTEVVSGGAYHTPKFNGYLEDCLVEYVRFVYGAEVTRSDDAEGFDVAPKTADASESVYARAYKANIDGVDRYFNYHLDDTKGNVSIWEKTKTTGENPHWTEKKISRLYTVTFEYYHINNNSKDPENYGKVQRRVNTAYALPGMDLTGYILDANKKFSIDYERETSADGTIIPAHTVAFRFHKQWAPKDENATYTMDDMKNVQQNMVFVAVYSTTVTYTETIEPENNTNNNSTPETTVENVAPAQEENVVPAQEPVVENAAVAENEEAVLPAEFVNEENVPAEAEVSAKEETAVLGFVAATGDNTPLFAMIVILLVSLGAVAFLGCKRGIKN